MYDLGNWFRQHRSEVWKSPHLILWTKHERTILHDLAINQPAKVKNIIAYNFVSTLAEVSFSVSGVCTPDAHGYRVSDFLIMNGDFESILMLCTSVLCHEKRKEEFPDVGRNTRLFARFFEKRVDFHCLAKCYDCLFSQVLVRPPPDIDTAYVWPKAGTTKRQLALGLGHLNVVELIDYMRLHYEGWLIFKHVMAAGAHRAGLLSELRAESPMFFALVQAGKQNGG